MAVRLMVPGFMGGGSSGGSEGPLSPGTLAAVNDTGTRIAWSNPSNAASSDNSYATASGLISGAGSDTTHYLKATNFGFSIPGGATITGIKVEIERKATQNSDLVKDNKIQLVKAGTIQSTNKATTTTWPTSDAVASYGGSSDLWSGSWTPSDINDSGFGVAIEAATKNVVMSNTETASVDHIKITVYYTT